MTLSGNKTTWQEDLKHIRLTPEKWELDHLSSIDKYEYISRYYTFSNEHVLALSNRFKYNIENGKILTVAGSGDQALSFVLNGAKQIDMVDINKLAYYLFVFKKAAIIALNNMDFIELMTAMSLGLGEKDIDTNLVNKVVSHIEEDDAYFFWHEIFCIYDQNKIRRLSRPDTCTKEGIEKYLPYSKENYEILKENIEKIKINFQIADLSKEKVGTYSYDFINLSNSVDYMADENIAELINHLVDRLKRTGTMVLFHSRGYCDEYDKYYKCHENNEYIHRPTNIKDYSMISKANNIHTFTRRAK